MNDIERGTLMAELKTRLEALEKLGELPWLGEVVNVTLAFTSGETRTFSVNAFTRPHTQAILREEHARLEAIALGVDRKVGP